MEKSSHKNKIMKTIIIGATLFDLAIATIFYFIWFQGMNFVFGLPLQMLMVTIILPITCCILLFWLARKLDSISWLEGDE